MQSAVEPQGLTNLELIGAGPHGRVYTAYDVRMDVQVAVKKLVVSSPAQEAKLTEEIAAIKRIKHVSHIRH